jgi:putative FmdB family regulatory protein
MPYYEYICNNCGKEDVKFSIIDNRDSQVCSCGSVLRQNYSKKRINIDKTLTGYYDNQLNAYISSTSERRKIEKQRGVEGVSTKSLLNSKPKKKKVDESKIREAVGNAVNILG